MQRRSLAIDARTVAHPVEDSFFGSVQRRVRTLGRSRTPIATFTSTTCGLLSRLLLGMAAYGTMPAPWDSGENPLESNINPGFKAISDRVGT
jgi:hypothetical protein